MKLFRLLTFLTFLFVFFTPAFAAQPLPQNIELLVSVPNNLNVFDAIVTSVPVPVDLPGINGKIYHIAVADPDTGTPFNGWLVASMDSSFKKGESIRVSFLRIDKKIKLTSFSNPWDAFVIYTPAVEPKESDN